MKAKLLKSEKDYLEFIKGWKNDDGTGVEDYKKQWAHYNEFRPEEYPCVAIKGDWDEGCKFDHESMVIVYKDDFNRDIFEIEL